MIENEIEDFREVLGEVSKFLSEFWQTSDPLLRMEKVIAAQRRIDSLINYAPELDPRVTGVYSRSNHPPGWGMPDNKAHGYVTLFVSCKDRNQLSIVSDRLASKPFLGILKGDNQYGAGALGEWYGGQFDFIASLPGNNTPVVDPHVAARRFRSLGDNRFVGHFLADEVLVN